MRSDQQSPHMKLHESVWFRQDRRVSTLQSETTGLPGYQVNSTRTRHGALRNRIVPANDQRPAIEENTGRQEGRARGGNKFGPCGSRPGRRIGKPSLRQAWPPRWQKETCRNRAAVPGLFECCGLALAVRRLRPIRASNEAERQNAKHHADHELPSERTDAPDNGKKDQAQTFRFQPFISLSAARNLDVKGAL